MDTATFESGYSSVYDALYGDKDYDRECQLIQDAIERFGNRDVRSIADWGCGTGNHSLRLARAGFDVVGVDRSPSMLEQAQRKYAALLSQRSAQDASGRAEFRLGDVAATSLGRVVDAAIMMFAVLSYQTTNQGVLATLRNVRRHLPTGGVFIADVWYGPSVLITRPGERVRTLQVDGREIVRAASTTLDTASHVACVTYDLWVHADQRLVSRSRETHRVRFFFPQEMALFFSMTGFALVSLTAFPTLDSPVSEQDWNAVAVAVAE